MGIDSGVKINLKSDFNQLIYYANLKLANDTRIR